MADKIFLDTNIVIDMLVANRQDKTLMQKFVKKLVECEIYISEDMLSTIFYITKDKTKTLEFFKVMQNKWQIVPFGSAVIRKAIDYSLKNSSDLEDTLQCFCAKANECDIFLTNDKKFIDCGIKILSYDEFLNGVINV